MMGIPPAIRSKLMSRAGATLIGIFLLVQLIWWAGPRVGLASPVARLAVIGVVIAIAVSVWLARRIISRRRGAVLKDSMQSHQEDRTSKLLEIQALREKMDDAIASLKASELGAGYRGSAALYALPWFMIIGPPAAGKTTLLRYSGLHFPYAHGDDIDIRGIGGTRNCDWWFSDKAVLLDTAGRYTTEEDDREEWHAFMRHLRKCRPKMPVNGVIVAISLADILTADDGGLDRHVTIIRDRLDEMTQQLGYIVPVFLVCTKCDLLNGFGAFFDDLGDSDRHQVWGAWLADTDADAGLAERFEAHLDALYKRLCEQRIRKLSLQRNFRHKNDIADFPAQFQTAASRLAEFFNLLVKDNPYQDIPNICGAYFTSGIQQGTPIQRILGSMRQAFGFVEESPPNAAEEQRSFFIRNVFQDCIFPHSRFGQRNRRQAIVHRLLKTAAIILGVTTVVGSGLTFSASYTAHHLLASRCESAVARLAEEVTAVTPSAPDLFTATRGVYAVHQQLAGYESRRPWHLRLGTYAGGRQRPVITEALHQGIIAGFLTPAMTALEHRLEAFHIRWDEIDRQGRESIRDDYYQALKVYLMAGLPDRLETPDAAPYLKSLWQKQVTAEMKGPLSEAEDRDMTSLVTWALARMKPTAGNPIQAWSQKHALIRAARDQLLTPPKADQLYALLLERGKPHYRERSLEELVGPVHAELLGGATALPGVFTDEAWYTYMKPGIAEAVKNACRGDWVTGSLPVAAVTPAAAVADKPTEAETLDSGYNADLARRLTHEIRRLYFADYAAAWYTLLGGMAITPFESLVEASQRLLIFQGQDGPIASVLSLAARHLTLFEKRPPAAAAIAASKAAGDTPTLIPRVEELDGLLGDLRKLTDPAEKMTVSLLINQYLLSLASVQTEIESITAAAEMPQEARIYAGRILDGSGGNLALYKCWVSTSIMLNSIEPRSRKIGSKLLIAPIRSAWNTILTEARTDLQQQWKSRVIQAYGRKLKGKFPFDGNGVDAALADVSDFFRRGDGILWAFVDDAMSPYIRRTRYGWQERRWLGQGIGFNKGAMKSLAHGRLITTSLFRHGSIDPGMHFYLYPIPARGQSEMSIECNGQAYRYRNEPQEWKRFRWPGDADRVGARVHGIAGRGISRAELRYDGIWGLFRLVRSADLVQQSDTQYLSTWRLEGRNRLPIQVQFQIKADRENNLFDKHVMAGFRLPESLF